MTNYSPLKALKIGLASVALAGSWLMANTASANTEPANIEPEKFVKAQGNQIVDGSGKPIFFNGVNLGNWLLWEGYLMVGHNGYLTHSQFLTKLGQAFGDTTKAKDFETNWRLNYVTSDTIDELASLGYNSVRVPFNYKLFWSDQTNSVTNEGFQYIDRLVGYCKARNMYILLDMHGAPGYQNPGDHSDNGNAKGWDDKNPAGQVEDRNTVTFWDGTTDANPGRNVQIASQVWQHIATYYKNEKYIWGYDLLNEPVSKENEGWRLIPAYKHMIKAIRAVDENHTVVLEGDWWASYMDSFTAKIDNNMVLQTHHYIHGKRERIPQLNDRADLANRLDVPIILGEFGEEDHDILRAIADIAEKRYDGAFAWSFKKLTMDKTLWKITPPQSYKNVIAALESGGRANVSDINDVVNNFAITGVQNKNTLNNTEFLEDFYKATKTPVVISSGCAPVSAFKAVTLPGTTVEAEEFDNGCADQAYSDSTEGNLGGSGNRNTNVDIGTTTDSSGFYVGWTAQGEWLNYTVTVAQAGDYTFDFRYASAANGATVTVTAGSNSVVTNLNSTGGWNNWSKATSGKVYLAAGPQTIRVTFNGGSNLNSFTATRHALPTVALADGVYNIVSNLIPISGDLIGQGLDVAVPAAGQTVNKIPIKLYEVSKWGGGLNQQWKITRVGDAYTITNQSTKAALDVPVSATGIPDQTKVQEYEVWNNTPGINQKWKFSPNAGGTYSIISAADDSKALDVPNGNAGNNAEVMQVYTADTTKTNKNQQWVLKKLY